MNDLIEKLHVYHILGETPIVLMLGSAAKGIFSHFDHRHKQNSSRISPPTGSAVNGS